ncbi:MAG: serine/threonine-protein phosphatase, partial [Verrucomicrobiota bacterium]|nr:serine/threonine-protein phosphatase [Verrucomicrobiota bacterium]
HRWNDMLSGHTVRGMFITALLGRIIPSQAQVELASAGHCSPFRIQPSGKAIEERQPGSPPLGIFPQLTSKTSTLRLEPGEWLVSFTDGLSESFDPADLLLDREGVARLLSRPFARATEVVDVLNQGEIDHRQGVDPQDDLTVLVFGFQ